MAISPNKNLQSVAERVTRPKAVAISASCADVRACADADDDASQFGDTAADPVRRRSGPARPGIDCPAPGVTCPSAPIRGCSHLLLILNFNIAIVFFCDSRDERVRVSSIKTFVHRFLIN